MKGRKSMSNRLDILDTPIQGLKLIQRKPLADDRGYLERMFCSEELRTIIPDKTLAQINRTLTLKSGVVRGMHFQYSPHAETKFVSCLRGEVFDVAVDLRQGSPTFLRWHSEVLSGDNRKTLVIPDGFAHGFQTLTADCEMLYFHTDAYRAECEGGVNAFDPHLAISWPLHITERSARDIAHPNLTNDFTGLPV
jgi:dTDP-4-dehydrorhamnose 3,5-epimerase